MRCNPSRGRNPVPQASENLSRNGQTSDDIGKIGIGRDGDDYEARRILKDLALLLFLGDRQAPVSPADQRARVSSMKPASRASAIAARSPAINS